MLFSQRKGFKPVRTKFQLDDMDDALRNRLWNAFIKSYESCGWDTMFELLWEGYFKEPVDTISTYKYVNMAEIRDRFFSCDWFEVYDFIEFVARNYPDPSFNANFVERCNHVLEREMSGNRFVGKYITQITHPLETTEIEQALEKSQPLPAVCTHLNSALRHLSDRKSPDFRNSIKESISAVEAMCRKITCKEKATLSQALEALRSKIAIHPALEGAFKKLYGYTSDAEGIRHALLKETNLCFEDAKFMLVSCCAFINYLFAKISKAGIRI